MSSEYLNAVIQMSAVLTVKTGLVALFTVRARLMSKTFNFKTESTNMLGAAFGPFLATFIPMGGSADMVQVGERVSLNNATNEPITVALALAGALAASPPPVILVKTFMYSRIAHNLSFFLMDYISAIPRTTFFSTGMVASFLMAGVLVM